MKRKTDDAGGGYYDVRGGLHSAELRMLQRALKEQLQEANRRKAQVKSMGFHLVKEQQEYIDALVRLSNRLRLEISPHVDSVPHGAGAGAHSGKGNR